MSIEKPESRDLRPVCQRCFNQHWPTEGCSRPLLMGPKDQYGNIVFSPLPKAREAMGDAILREAKARQERYEKAVLNRMNVPVPVQEAKTDDRVLQENTKVSWSSAICDDCHHIRTNGRGGVTRLVERQREQCCDCGMPTKSGIYIRVDPMTVRYPRVVRDE